MNASKHNPVWNLDFLFLSNQLALDLLNTRPAPDGVPIEQLLDFSALLAWFLAAKMLRAEEADRFRRHWSKSTRAADVLQKIRQFREALRGEVLRWEDGHPVSRAFVQQLNSLLASHPLREKVVADANRLVSESWFKAQDPEDLLGPLAHAAAELFTTLDRERVRKCDHCVAHFYDISKKGTRRWCSMQLCGNRFKVSAYAARNRRRTRRTTTKRLQDPA